MDIKAIDVKKELEKPNQMTSRPFNGNGMSVKPSFDKLDSSSCVSGTCSLTSITSVIPHHPDSHYSTQGEALELLKDRIKKRCNDVRKAFAMFRLSPEEPHILRSHFRLVLDTFCFPLSEALFQSIAKKCIQTPNGLINYKNFFKHYGTDQDDTPTTTVEIIGPSITLEEMEMKIHTQAIQKVKPISLAFQMMDRNKDGKVQLSEMQKIIEHFCGLRFSKESYQRLWSRYDQRDTGLVDYQEFLKKLALNTSQYQQCLPNLNMKIALTWPDANLENYAKQKQRLALLHHSDDPLLKGLPLEQIEKLIKEKIIKEYKVLKRAFLIMDTKGTGTVPFNYFRSTLAHFTYPMSQQLFSQLMIRFGIKPSERVCWKELLDQICTQRKSGTAAKTINISKQNHHNRKAATSGSISQIVSKLIQLRIQPGISIHRSFNLRSRFGGEEDFSITRQELRLMIERKGNLLMDNEIKELLVTLDPGHTNFISYSKFCNLFGFEKKPDFQDTNMTDVHPADETKSRPKNTRLRAIPWDKLVAKLKSKVHRNYDVIEKSLGACDYEQKGWIHSQQLRQVLHKFCFQITDEEFRCLLQMVDAVDEIVNIRRFLDVFRETEKERLQNWSSLVTRLTKPSSPKPWSEDQLDTLLQELLSGDRQNFLNSFQAFDIQGKGRLSKEDVARLLSRHMGRLRESEFEMIWKKLPLDKHGQFDYVTFFESQVSLQSDVGSLNSGSNSNHHSRNDFNQENKESNRTKSNTSTERLASLSSSRSSSKYMVAKSTVHSFREVQKPSPRPTTAKSSKSQNVPATNHREKSRPVTSILDLVKSDIQLRQILARKWRDVKEKCSALDVGHTGMIGSDQFLDILIKSGIPVSTKPVLHLLQSKYNLRLDVPISYINFLRDIFLTVGRSNRDFQIKRLIESTSLPEETPQLYSILLDLRIPVLSKWKSLKKAFRRHDLLGNGCIQVYRFRRSLSEHNIVISDTDFHVLTKYLDPHTIGTVRYMEFLAIFMKSIN